MLLRIADLEAIRSIVETKVKELRLVDRSKGPQQTPDQEHKLVSRVIGDTIQIMLGYFEPQEALGMFKNVFGAEFGQISDQKETVDNDQVLRNIQNSLKEL